MKIIASIALLYSFGALAFILSICKAAARPMPPPPPKSGDTSGTQQPRTIHETHV